MSRISWFMRHARNAASLALLTATCAACSSPPSSICEMPPNRHFWQGVDVSWRGEIIDLVAPTHKGGIYFTDSTCGETIEIDSRALPKLYSSADHWSGHLAVAQFSVTGHLIYEDGKIVFRPTSLERTSEWMSEDQSDAYIDKMQATLRESGLPSITTQRPRATHSP